MNDYEQAHKIIFQAQPDTADDGPVVLTHREAEFVKQALQDAINEVQL